MAVEMVEEGLLTKEEAILRVGADQLNHLLHPMLDPKAEKNVIATGLPASPGAAVGMAVFNAEDAEKWKESKAKFAEKASRFGKLILAAGVATAAAYVGLKAQSNRANNIAAQQGNYKVSLSTVMHKSAKNQ